MKKNPFLYTKAPLEYLTSNKNSKKLIEWFYSYDIKNYTAELKNKTEEYWKRKSRLRALDLFHKAAKYVPAYKDFLKRKKINHILVKTYKDFQKIPIIDKKNYISKYPLEALCWKGNIEGVGNISFSSGATGNAFFWPRGIYQDIEGALFHEHLLTSQFEIDKHSTLLVICFSLGGYVAGTYTLASTKPLVEKGYPLTIITPGISYEDTFRMVKQFAPKFEQIIMCGYPPFVKDLIDLGKEEKINWKKYKTRFLLASEFFSEAWRKNIFEHSGATDILSDSTNVYGAADATLFGFETPVTTAIRQETRKNKELSHELFNSNLTPTLVQYNPMMRFFETANGELIITAAAGIPLVRYNLHDQGSYFTFSDIGANFKRHNIQIEEKLRRNENTKTVNNLPFVYIVGRTDGAASFYGILIYPEYIKGGLESGLLRNKVSGKFTLLTKYDRQQNQFLEIHVELNPRINVNKSLEKDVNSQIQKSMRERCAEYSFLEDSIGRKAIPKIILHKKGQSEYFKIGIKQKWVVEQN